MDLFQMMQNIRNVDKEKEIKEAIESARLNLQGLTEERTCKIYSGFILDELKARHVSARLVSTTDLGFSFEHQFVLVPLNETTYFVIDLTVSQFGELFPQLTQQGYEEMDNQTFNTYLRAITLGEKEDIFSMNDVFYMPLENYIETKK